MTVYVRTINGKTISIKWDRQQKTARILETVETKTSIPRDMMYLVSQGKVLNDKVTMEENSIEAEATQQPRQKRIYRKASYGKLLKENG